MVSPLQEDQPLSDSGSTRHKMSNDKTPNLAAERCFDNMTVRRCEVFGNATKYCHWTHYNVKFIIHSPERIILCSKVSKVGIKSLLSRTLFKGCYAILIDEINLFRKTMSIYPYVSLLWYFFPMEDSFPSFER